MAAVVPVVQVAGRVVLRTLLIPFAALAGYFVAWGMVFCMDAIVRAFFGTVTGSIGWIPYAGRIVTSPLNRIEQKLTSFLGGLEAHFEHQMAARWHTLAAVVKGYADDTVAAAVYDWHVAQSIAKLYSTIAAYQPDALLQQFMLHELRRLRGVPRLVIHTVKVIAHPTTGPIAAGAAARVKPFARALEHVIEWDLPGLRARDRAINDQIGRLWNWTRTHGVRAGEAVGVGALVYALARIGAGWIRCGNVRRLGRRACGLDPNLLEALIADTLILASAISIVELARELQGAMPEVLSVVRLGIREAHAADLKIRAAAQTGP